MVFFNFFNLFAIFLEFSITRRVGMKRNDNFYFLYFSAFSNYFGWKLSHMGIYYFYEFCYYFFGIFNYGSGGWDGSEQYVSLSLFLGLLQRILDRKEATMEFSITRQVRKNTIMASFQSKIGWRRPRKRDKENYRSDPFLTDSYLKIPKK